MPLVEIFGLHKVPDVVVSYAVLDVIGWAFNGVLGASDQHLALTSILTLTLGFVRFISDIPSVIGERVDCGTFGNAFEKCPCFWGAYKTVDGSMVVIPS